MIPLSPRSALPLFSFSLLTVALALQHLEQLLDALVARLQRLLLRLYPRLQLLQKQSDDDDLRDLEREFPDAMRSPQLGTPPLLTYKSVPC